MFSYSKKKILWTFSFAFFVPVENKLYDVQQRGEMLVHSNSLGSDSKTYFNTEMNEALNITRRKIYLFTFIKQT